jgi:hypothetical protein
VCSRRLHLFGASAVIRRKFFAGSQLLCSAGVASPLDEILVDEALRPALTHAPRTVVKDALDLVKGRRGTLAR